MDKYRARKLLKDLSNYGWDKFQSAHNFVDLTNSKHIMLIAYMSQAQVNFDGIISLTRIAKPQAAAATLQLRTLQEYFINTKLVTLQNDDTFASYLYINSEYERIKTTKMLLRLGEISQTNCDRVLEESNQIINILKRQTKLPLIPHLILADRDYYGKSQFDLRKKCEIIDALDTNNESAHSMVSNYDVVYKQLSKYVHTDARTILHDIGYNSHPSIININGDASLYEDMVGMSCMYYASILEIFTKEMNIYEGRRFKLFMNRYIKYIHAV